MQERLNGPRKTYGARLIAALLLVAFLLQSATQASQGCLSRVFMGACCCETATPARAVSCCAEKQEAPEQTEDPRIEDQSACSCTQVLLPNPPAAPQSPDQQVVRALDLILHAEPLPHLACTFDFHPARIDSRALGRPPDAACTGSPALQRIRLAQRGMAGFLSELCTLIR